MISRTSSLPAVSFLALLGIAACANLTPIQEGVCGNAVTESGEDCDGESNCYGAGTAFACRYRCETDDDCLEGACGVDFVCRRPSGSFAVKQSVPSSATLSLASGDLDADGKDDVIREGAELTDVLFIGEDGLIEAAETVERLREINPPVIADLTEVVGAEEANRLDLAFSVNLGDETGSGLSVYRTQQDRTLEATAYPTVPIPGTKIRGVTARVVGGDQREEIVGFVEGGMAVPSFAGFGAEQELVSLALDRNPNVGAFAGLAVGELVDNGCDEVVYAELPNGNVTGRDVWVVVPCETNALGNVVWRQGAAPNAEVTTLTLPPDVVLAYPDDAFFDGPEDATTGLIRNGIFVADFQGDGRDDVFAVAVGDDETPRLFVAVRTDTGFTNFMPLPCGDVCGDLGYPLAVADLGAGPAADFVFEEGIVLSVDPAMGGVFVAFDAQDGASWLAAEIADFDRDGIPDVAVSRTDDDGDGPTQGIEILRNTGSGLFTRDLVPTQRPVAHITTGDFDGDGAADLAYVEHDFSTALPATQGPGSGFPMHVAFGQTSGGLTATRKLGELVLVEQIIAGPVLGGDGAAELLALAEPQNKTALAIFGGNASRQLVAPFFFSFRLNTGDLVAGRIDAAVAGTFDEDGRTQLAVLTHSITTDDVMQPYPEDVLWRVNVGAEAELMSNPQVGTLTQPPEASCFECLLVAYDPDGDGVDDLYAFEDLTLLAESPSAGMRIRRFTPTDEGFEEAAVVAEIPDLIAPVAEELLSVNPPLIRDLDGDGDDDLALIGAYVEQEVDDDGDGDVGFGISDQVVLIFYNDGGTLGDFEVVLAPTQPEEGVAFVTAFTFLQVDPDPDLELVVSEIVDNDDQETGSVWILDYDPTTGGYGEPQFRRPLVAGPELPLLVRALTSGDYDGDGVDDVIVGGDEFYVVVRGEPAQP